MDQENLFEEFDKDIELKNKIASLDQLFKQSARYKTSAEFIELLKFINKFPWLSPFNAFLVYVQNPGVKIVLSSTKWRKHNRFVKPFARPLVILVPFGPVDFVYDIADTEGEEIPEFFYNPFYTRGELDPKAYFYSMANTEKQNIKISEYEMGKNSAGYARRIKNKLDININSSYHINEKYSTLVHELAHIFCGHLGTIENSWWQDRSVLDKKNKELEAESISYLVCQRMGLKTQSHSYLSDYVSGDQWLHKISLDTILTVSGYIEQMGTSSFKSKMKKTKQ